jgi:hypothetical protein
MQFPFGTSSNSARAGEMERNHVNSQILLSSKTRGKSEGEKEQTFPFALIPSVNVISASRKISCTA